ncbi:phosphopantetheine-binding protein [Nocardia carnea]|uniref:phosphopantetheine-binding protein n=1 Tax=Nocardia carnea TaxID=37328 RepID=UPI002457C986|nr:phosphopantetheine-binding protein [Nocardia carnea]
MTAGITSRADAVTLVRRSLQGFATQDEIIGLDEHQPLRSTLELDSIDFLTFVERLAAGSGRRIDEDDYSRLATIESCAEFLTTPR